MASFVEGKSVPGGGAKFAKDAAQSGGGDVIQVKLLIGNDGTLTFVADAAGQRVPVKAVISDTADTDVKTGDAANNAQRVNIVAGAAAVGLQIDDAPFTPGTSQGVPAMFVYDDTAPDEVDEGDAGAARMAKDRLIYTTGYPRGLIVQNAVSLTGTTETTLLSAVAALFVDLTGIWVYNQNATTAVTVSIRDATAGTVRFTLPLAANQGSNILFRQPWLQTAVNNNWTIQLSAAVSTVYVHAQGVKRVS
jgi:hypothetical protein